MDQRIAATDGAPRRSRFELAPPRRFLLPAILLLLSEEPGYGYSLVKDLRDFGFGQVDRPSVYRALARLEADGLVAPWTGPSSAGQARRVYTLTMDGARALREWMGVIKEERSCLDRVLRRYRATGSGDAVLAEVEGQWAAMLGPEWSPVSPTSTTRWGAPAATARVIGQRSTTAGEPPEPADQPDRDERVGAGTMAACSPDALAIGDTCPHGPSRFLVVPDRSAVLIEARSTVGPISFGALGLTGTVEASLSMGVICPCAPPAAHVELAVDGLRSGNRLYDAELLRRIDARRFPVVSMELRDSDELGSHHLYRLAGEITFHGVTRSIQGTAEVEAADERRLLVTGEQVIDIRDFDVASPTVLMLRIYPDVRVRLHLEAELEG